jgi:hypothetical protein
LAAGIARILKLTCPTALHRDDKRVAADQRLHLIVGEGQFYIKTISGRIYLCAVEQ